MTKGALAACGNPLAAADIDAESAAALSLGALATNPDPGKARRFLFAESISKLGHKPKRSATGLSLYRQPGAEGLSAAPPPPPAHHHPTPGACPSLPSTLYNSMIAPLLSLRLSGFLWCQ